jgi:hypothetical protein
MLDFLQPILIIAIRKFSFSFLLDLFVGMKFAIHPDPQHRGSI